MGSRVSAGRRGPSPSLYVSLLSDFLPPSSGLLPPLPRLAFLRLHSLPLSGIREQCGYGGRRCVSVGSSEPQCAPTRPPPSPLPPPPPPPPLPALAPAAPKARGNGSCVGAGLPRSPRSWAPGYCWPRQPPPPSAVPAPPQGPEAAAPPAGLQQGRRAARPAARPPLRHRRRPPGPAPAGRPGRGGAGGEPQLPRQAGSAVAWRPREKLLVLPGGTGTASQLPLRRPPCAPLLAALHMHCTSSFNVARGHHLLKEKWVAAALSEERWSTPRQRGQRSRCSLIHVSIQRVHSSATCFHKQRPLGLEKMRLVIGSCLRRCRVRGWGT